MRPDQTPALSPAPAVGLSSGSLSGLSLEGISRQFGPVQALRHVSFALAPGEILCLLGASGCGKSTLLRLIAGVDSPDEGEIRLQGRVLAGAGVSVPPEARGIGFMFQDYALFPHLSVAENVAFGLKGWARGAAQARVAEVLAVAGVAALSSRFPHELSGGESQRVALARALAPRPGLLLMDEPFSNLDQGLRETVRAETLALLRQMGVGAIIVTHDPQEALTVADRLILMRAGRVEAIGTPRGLYHAPPSLYAARFLGPGSALAGPVQGQGLATPLGRFAAPGLAEGQAAVAFFRPQALVLCAMGEGVPARIERREFLGGQERLWLRLEEGGGAVLLDMPTCPLTEAGGETAGEGRVFLRLAPQRVQVFAQEAGGADKS